MSSHHVKHDGKLVETPVEHQQEHSGNYKGGPGVYDGAEGLPKRTPGHGGVAEKVYDEAPPLKKGEG